MTDETRGTAAAPGRQPNRLAGKAIDELPATVGRHNTWLIAGVGVGGESYHEARSSRHAVDCVARRLTGTVY